jgi:hypothetical protein
MTHPVPFIAALANPYCDPLSPIEKQVSLFVINNQITKIFQ